MSKQNGPKADEETRELIRNVGIKVSWLMRFGGWQNGDTRQLSFGIDEWGWANQQFVGYPLVPHCLGKHKLDTFVHAGHITLAQDGIMRFW